MRQVFLSKVAEFKLNGILAYLRNEWSESERITFLEQFRDRVENIRNFPMSCQKSESMPEIYRCVVTNQTSFYYRIYSDNIEIITIVDNRQDPDQTLIELNSFLNN